MYLYVVVGMLFLFMSLVGYIVIVDLSGIILYYFSAKRINLQQYKCFPNYSFSAADMKKIWLTYINELFGCVFVPIPFHEKVDRVSDLTVQLSKKIFHGKGRFW